MCEVKAWNGPLLEPLGLLLYGKIFHIMLFGVVGGACLFMTGRSPHKLLVGCCLSGLLAGSMLHLTGAIMLDTSEIYRHLHLGRLTFCLMGWIGGAKIIERFRHFVRFNKRARLDFEPSKDF